VIPKINPMGRNRKCGGGEKDLVRKRLAKKTEIKSSIPRETIGVGKKRAITERIVANNSSDPELRAAPVNLGMAVIIKPIAKESKNPPIM
jgi:hypothetical protein